MPNLKQAALEYARMGFSIFPLRPGTKEPSVSGWKPYAVSPSSLELVSEWWTKTPDSNIGLPTGSLNKIAVVDLDGETGLAFGRMNKLFSPVTSLTGKGQQLFYQYRDGIVNSASKLAPNVDVRGEGGYVVAPPSIHPNGKLYRWLGSALGAAKLPEFPSLATTVTPVTSGTTPSTLNPPGWIGELLNNLSEGNRNDTFFRIAARLHRDGYKLADMLALLSGPAEKAGFPRPELELCLRSATRYDAPALGHTVPSPLLIRTWGNSKEEYEKRKSKHAVVEYDTGFRELTRLTNGYQRKEVSVVAARTGVGKTNVVSYTARALAAKHNVLVFSTETPFYRLYDRIGLETVKTGRISVVDDSMPSLDNVAEAIEKTGASVVIFDHINHVSEEYEGLSKYIHGLKSLAMRADVPVIVAAQLSRQADQIDNRTGRRVQSGMHMIKGSGTIEQIAAHVLLITEVAKDDRQIDLEANLVKNRYGETGKFYLRLLKSPWRLEEVV